MNGLQAIAYRFLLNYYDANKKVGDLYDEDEIFATALSDLVGSDFEYPDFSHKTVGEVLKQFGGPTV